MRRHAIQKNKRQENPLATDAYQVVEYNSQIVRYMIMNSPSQCDDDDDGAQSEKLIDSIEAVG